jgi:hypothetical protein
MASSGKPYTCEKLLYNIYWVLYDKVCSPMRSSNHQQIQQQHNHKFLQYFCSKRGILLKETEGEEILIANNKIVLTPATATEQCVRWSLLSSKNLLRK